MGHWAIHIEGSGLHDNKRPDDADQMLNDFVHHLAERGHRVESATITTGTTKELLNQDDTTPLAANAVHQWRDREHGTGVPIEPVSDGKTHGQRAYEAYSKHVGGISVNGDELPDWDSQLGGIREAWEAAGAAVRS